MKALLDFIKYNNAFPVILFVTLLATGAVFAASPELREAVLVPEQVPLGPPEKADASKLLSTDVGHYNLSLRIDAIKEDTKTYFVTYSYNTFEVAKNAWQEVRKTKHIDVPKELLGKRDLKEYLTAQINQVLAQERRYLEESKRLAQGDATQRDSLAYAGLVGQDVASQDIPATVETGDSKEEIEKPGTTNETVVSSPTLPVSQEELQKMIVAAVAEFLAIDTSMPEAAQQEATSSEPETSPALSEEGSSVEGTISQ